jgi:hypothetical protein
MKWDFKTTSTSKHPDPQCEQYHQMTQAELELIGREWSSSHSSHHPHMHWTEGLVGPRAGPDTEQRRKSLKMLSSGTWRSAALVKTDVSEENVTSIIRVEKSSELGTMFARTSSWSMLWRNARANGHHISEDGILHSDHYENLKSYTGERPCLYWDSRI